MSMNGSYLIIRRTALREDSWTYDDWRQYVAFLDDGSAVCCRISQLPFLAFALGVGLLTMAALCLFMALSLQVNWANLGVLSFAGFVLCGPEVVSWCTPWRVVKCVGDRMMPNGDGTYTRPF